MAPSSLRPSSLAFRFLVLLGLLVILARAAALVTKGPWFSPTVTLYTYTVTLIATSLAAILASLVAADRAARFDEVLRTLDARLGDVRGTGERPVRRAEAAVPAAPRAIDDALEDILYRQSPNRGGVVSSGPEPSGPREPEDRRDIREDLTIARQALEAARKDVWPTVAGPLVLSTLFAGLAGAMLPGAEGFAVNHHQLNTTLILIMGPGWAVVLLWLVIALMRLPSFEAPGAGRGQPPKVEPRPPPGG